MSGQTGNAWGVHFENSTGTAPFYVLFQGVYSTTSTSGSRYRLPADVSYVTSSIASGASTTVTFPFLSGVPAVSSTITMKLNNGTSTTIVVNGLSGLIGFGSPALTGFLASSWSSTTAFSGVYSVPSALYNNYIYSVGGERTGGATAAVRYVLPNADGSIGNWTSTTSLPPEYTAVQQANAAYGGYLYAIGGFDSLGNRTSTERYALINATGSVGNWTSTTVLPSPLTTMSSAVHNGYIYLFGGVQLIGQTTTTVRYVQINGNGTLGNWSSTTALKSELLEEAAVSANGYAYLLGGGDDFVGVATTTVSYAKFNADNTLGSWSLTTALPYAVVDPLSVTYGGFIYVIGGFTNYSQTNATTTVVVATVNSDGTLGPWQYTTALPSAIGWQGGVAENGYIYSIGGATSTGGAATTTVNFIQIH